MMMLVVVVGKVGSEDLIAEGWGVGAKFRANNGHIDRRVRGGRDRGSDLIEGWGHQCDSLLMMRVELIFLAR